MKHLIFYRTNDVFLAEERLQKEGVGVEIVPTPVQDKAYCGVCVRIDDGTVELAQRTLSGLEYKIVG